MSRSPQNIQPVDSNPYESTLSESDFPNQDDQEQSNKCPIQSSSPIVPEQSSTNDPLLFDKQSISIQDNQNNDDDNNNNQNQNQVKLMTDDVGGEYFTDLIVGGFSNLDCSSCSKSELIHEDVKLESDIGKSFCETIKIDSNDKDAGCLNEQTQN